MKRITFDAIPQGPERQEGELLARIMELEAKIDQMASANAPANIEARLQVLSNRINAIEGDEDQLPPVLPEEVSWDSYVYVDKRPVAITGTHGPIVWVNVTAEPPLAFYSSTWQTPFPDGYVLYDLRKRQIHIPRLG